MRKKICREAGCNVLIDTGSYCKDHIKEKKKPFENAIRNNVELYNTNLWKKLRKIMLVYYPFCCKCGNEELLQVHHRVNPMGDDSLFFDLDNLEVVCENCHRIITANSIHDRNCHKLK